MQYEIECTSYLLLPGIRGNSPWNYKFYAEILPKVEFQKRMSQGKHVQIESFDLKTNMECQKLIWANTDNAQSKNMLYKQTNVNSRQILKVHINKSTMMITQEMPEYGVVYS